MTHTNVLNRKLEEVFGVGKEFTTVAALWGVSFGFSTTFGRFCSPSLSGELFDLNMMRNWHQTHRCFSHPESSTDLD